jgi:hypothetical protein
MAPGKRALLLMMLGLGLGSVPAVARAQAARPASGPAQSAGLEGERRQLRLRLAAVNAEIDALKSADRGLRDDYRLRARLADAEAIARRLIELDAQLPARAPAAGPAAAAHRHDVEPAAAPTDGPAELDAKADILADQSRRAQAQLQALQARAEQLSRRQELRRHSGQLEHDPFAPLDGSRRRAVTSAALIPRGSYSPPINAASSITGAAPTPQVDRSSAPPPASSAAPPVYLRSPVDADAPAEVRQLEDDGGASSTNVEAIRRAIAALTLRARHLDAEAQALRERARNSR